VWLAHDTPTLIARYSPLNYFCDQPLEYIQQKMQRVHVLDPTLTNEEHAEHKVFLFQIFA
jgi:hypothetical protein